MFKRIDGRIDINSELQSGNIKFDKLESDFKLKNYYFKKK